MPTSNPDNSSCTQGGFPVYAVNVSSVSHIQLAINFARNNKLRLVIKNTGHCYLGKSSGAGTLSIWTHNLKDITYYPHLDVPSYSGPVMKIGAGVTVKEVYQAAHRNNVSALGGICEVSRSYLLVSHMPMLTRYHLERQLRRRIHSRRWPHASVRPLRHGS